MAAAEEAVKRLHSYEMNGRELRVESAIDKLGGGPSLVQLAGGASGGDLKAAQGAVAGGTIGAIAQRVETMTAAQMYTVMGQLRTIVEKNRDQAKKLLTENPHLSIAFLRIQERLHMLGDLKLPPPSADQVPVPSQLAVKSEGAANPAISVKQENPVSAPHGAPGLQPPLNPGMPPHPQQQQHVPPQGQGQHPGGLQQQQPHPGQAMGGGFPSQPAFAPQTGIALAPQGGGGFPVPTPPGIPGPGLHGPPPMGGMPPHGGMAGPSGGMVPLQMRPGPGLGMPGMPPPQMGPPPGMHPPGPGMPGPPGQWPPHGGPPPGLAPGLGPHMQQPPPHMQPPQQQGPPQQQSLQSQMQPPPGQGPLAGGPGGPGQAPAAAAAPLSQMLSALAPAQVEQLKLLVQLPPEVCLPARPCRERGEGGEKEPPP